VAVSLAWQWVSLPAMPSDTALPVRELVALLKRRHVATALAAVMLAAGGAFATFTYLRPFLMEISSIKIALGPGLPALANCARVYCISSVLTISQ
jgi:predicted MFS family arabinose efflux permease